MVKIGVAGFPAPTFWDYLEIANEIGFRYIELSADAGPFAFPGGEFVHIKGKRNYVLEAPYDIKPVHMAFPQEYADEKGRPKKDLLERITTYNMTVNMIYGRNDFVQFDNTKMNRQVEIVKELCDLTVKFDCDLLRLHGGYASASQIQRIGRKKCEKLIVDGFRKCVKYAENTGVDLAMENHMYLTNDAEMEVRIFEAVGSENLGALVDTGNYGWYGYPPETIERIFEMIAPYTKHTHMKDAVRRTDSAGEVGEINTTVLGKGEIPLKTLIEELKKNGYNGAYHIQYEVLRIGKDADHGVFEGLRRCYDNLVSLL